MRGAVVACALALLGCHQAPKADPRLGRMQVELSEARERVQELCGRSKVLAQKMKRLGKRLAETESEISALKKFRLPKAAMESIEDVLSSVSRADGDLQGLRRAVEGYAEDCN